MDVKKQAKWLNISLKILIFHDVWGPHWTLSHAARAAGRVFEPLELVYTSKEVIFQEPVVQTG